MPRKRRMRGGKLSVSGVVSALKKANNYLKANKLISRGANTLGSLGVPYASRIGSVASSLGYGQRRRRRRK